MELHLQCQHVCAFFRIRSSDSQIKDPAENRNPQKKNKHIYLSIEATNKLTTYIKTQKGRIPSLRYAVYCSSYVVDFIE